MEMMNFKVMMKVVVLLKMPQKHVKNLTHIEL